MMLLTLSCVTVLGFTVFQAAGSDAGSGFRAGSPVSISSDCTSAAPFSPTWRSVGYTPAELALQYDEMENMAVIASTPNHGVEQIRVHYLLDLLVTTSWVADSSSPSGWRVGYVWTLLDEAMDWLVANELSPGFELMGSPVGFPQLPISFWEDSSGNGKFTPNQTAGLWRQVVADTLVHYAGRYGASAAEEVRWETWNEPDSGWGWQLPPDNATNVAGYLAYFDATGAGVGDAEAASGLRFALTGPAVGNYAHDRLGFLPAVFDHFTTGRNVWTGGPVRLDVISAHCKGEATSYKVIECEWGLSALIRGNPTWAASLLPTLAISNDEGDPMVGWGTPEDWRGDARYAAIMAKEINQHLVGIADNATGNNPLGLLSFDAGFINTEPTFGQRTMTAKLTDTSGARVGFVRKTGLSAFALLSRVGTQRCSVSVNPPSDALMGNYGVFVTVQPANGSEPAYATLLVYNSADCSNATAPTITVSTSLTGLPFAPEQPDVVSVQYQIDDAHGNTAALWTSQGSPSTPTPAQLEALWAAGPPPLLAPPVPVTVSSGGAVTLAPFDLPLPGLAVIHIAAKPAAPPAAPASVQAFVKPPGASLLDPAEHSEVLVRWPCAAAAKTTSAYVVQFSPTAPPAAAWETVNSALPPDMACLFYHAAPPAPPGNGTLFSGWYRVAAVDYWGRTGNWSAAGTTQVRHMKQLWRHV